MKKIRNNFINPGIEYRSAPFWSWNDNLETEELNRQLDLMKEGGFGGSFMHSRMGLITPYFSRQWMDCVKSTVEHSKKIGLLAYLYDEDRWPSGFAGGVATKNKNNRMLSLIVRKINGKLNFSKEINPPSPDYNNSAYLDTANKKAVKAFIDSTYEPYKKHFKNDFKKTIPAIFTDEPNYNTRYYDKFGDKQIIALLPWTSGFDEIFKKTYSYDLNSNLKALIEDEGNFTKIRYDYWKLIHELFLEHFAKQIYDWCGKNGIDFTGHYLGENDLTSQISCTGSSMAFYEYMHIPGIDHLCKQIEPMWLCAKQCVSVANQTGRKRVISEIFGASGQDFSLADRKWIGDWDMVMGVNLFCPHLWLYSMRGCRKRDYPPTISYQQPYWKYNKPIEDYFARVNYIMSQGKPVSDILVIHPIESGYALFKPGPKRITKNEVIDKINNKFSELTKQILANHYSLDFGDESQLAKYAKVERINGKTYFTLGKMSYSLIILPGLLNIRKSTLELLKKFLDFGGKVVSIASLPDLVDGEQNKQVVREYLSKMLITEEKNIIKIIEELAPGKILIKNKGGEELAEILCNRKIINENTEVYFLANTNRNKDYKADIKIKGEGHLECWDGFSGKMYAVPVKKEKGCLLTNMDFSAAGSRLLVLTKEKRNLEIVKSGESSKLLTGLKNNWRLERKEPNSLSLDMCSYKLDNDKNWSKATPVITLQHQLEKEARVRKVVLRYSFKTDFTRLPDNLALVFEQPEIFGIKINDKPAHYKDTGWWIDKSFKKLAVAGYIKPRGTNIIELNCKFIPPVKPKTIIYIKEGVELESVYITGDFAVKGKFKTAQDGYLGEGFVLENEKNAVNKKDFVLSGYPFYAGSMKLRQDFDIKSLNGKRIILKIVKFNAAVAGVKINNREAGFVFLPPYEIDITKLVEKGSNSIEIELVNTLRNLLGPHHHSSVTSEWVGPDEFEQNEYWIDKYTFVPFGFGKVELRT
ncbi:MAG: hypothetical protein A2252_02315 [Elusimicrobia bacterium RIFOXYA2_FULL_39_19]|nr:MAG: hypothetical protein A2252_02315 [Elusimicrobia bacterium RIFOXYA2_FULL_39_19]